MTRKRAMHGRSRYVVLTPEDAHEIGEAIKAKFPDARFLTHHYWCRRDKEKGHIDLKPPDLHLRYYESLGDPDESWFRIWREPEGWQPEWFGPNQNGIYFVANEPPLQVSYRTGGTPHNNMPMYAYISDWALQETDPRKLRDPETGKTLPEFWRKEPPAAEPGYEQLATGRFTQSYWPPDSEHRKFIGQVWRIVAAHTTSMCVTVDLRTMRPFRPPAKRRGIWLGRHALDWARQGEHRFLAGGCKPADWYDDWLARQQGENDGDEVA
jgi:hypothetical protein